MTVVVTRPLPDGERTAAALRAKGIDVLAAPLLRIEPVAADLDGAWAAVIATSANALRAIADKATPLRRLPLFVVGTHSAAVARDAGFADVRSANGDAGDLVRLVAASRTEIASRADHPILYLAADHRAADVAGQLSAVGVHVTTRVVYRMAGEPLPPALVGALDAGTIRAVLHYSRRSAEIYVAGAAVAGLLAQALAPRQLCLSRQVAAALEAAGAKNIAIAGRPDEDAMMALLDLP